jgi:CO/xanthine dehydrogenase Mo-binding subunit
MSTGSMYSSPNRRVVSHAVPMVGYPRGAPLRSPLDLSFSFASEEVIEMLARAAGIDSLAFRRNYIGDPRWLGVLNAAAAAAGLSSGLPRSTPSTGDVVTGWGIGLGTHHVSYGAAIAEIEVNKRTGVTGFALTAETSCDARPDHTCGPLSDPCTHRASAMTSRLSISLDAVPLSGNDQQP